MATSSPQNGSAQDQVNKLVNQDAAKGRVAVHTFDPDETPQQKAAAAGKGSEQLKSKNAEPGVGERGKYPMVMPAQTTLS
jgi:hypothetical protein